MRVLRRRGRQILVTIELSVAPLAAQSLYLNLVLQAIKGLNLSCSGDCERLNLICDVDEGQVVCRQM